jgi:hypothetical protein
MVTVHGVHVSANHYVTAPDGTMIPAGEHPAATAAVSLDRIWCLATSDHRIPIVTVSGVVVFADYEESSDPAVIAEAQRIAESSLNHNTCGVGPTVPDYSLGLDPTFNVLMRNLTWKSLARIEIGDSLMGGATVTGLIREVCDVQVQSPGGHNVSAAQLIMHEGCWVRAAHVWPITECSGPLLHLMVAGKQQFTVGGDGETIVVRDYAEVSASEMQTPYDKSLKGVAATAG